MKALLGIAATGVLSFAACVACSRVPPEGSDADGGATVDSGHGLPRVRSFSPNGADEDVVVIGDSIVWPQWAALSFGDSAWLVWAQSDGAAFRLLTLDVDDTFADGGTARGPTTQYELKDPFTTETYFAPRPGSELMPLVYFWGLHPNRYPVSYSIWTPDAGMRFVAACDYAQTPYAGAWDGTTAWLAPKGQNCTGACAPDTLELREVRLGVDALDAGAPLCTGIPVYSSTSFEVSFDPGRQVAVASSADGRFMFRFARDGGTEVLAGVNDSDVMQLVDAGMGEVTSVGAGVVWPGAERMLVPVTISSVSDACLERTRIYDVQASGDGGYSIQLSALSSLLGRIRGAQVLEDSRVILSGSPANADKCGARSGLAVLANAEGTVEAAWDVPASAGDRWNVAEHHGQLVLFTAEAAVEDGGVLRYQIRGRALSVP